MTGGALPKRYARALMAYAREHSLDLEALSRELSDFAVALGHGTPLGTLLANRLVQSSRKTQALEKVIKRLSLSPLLGNFLRLLQQRDRLLLLPEISDAFRNLADEQEGILRGQVVAATPLPKESLDSLKEKLAARMSRRVILSVRTNPAIIGGLVVTVGSLSFDGSIRAQMDSLRKKLSERVIP